MNGLRPGLKHSHNFAGQETSQPPTLTPAVLKLVIVFRREQREGLWHQEGSNDVVGCVGSKGR